MTFNEIIHAISNLRENGRQSDDNTLSHRQLAFHISGYRAQILKQDIQKGRSVNPDTVQNLGKVRIKKIDPRECNCDIKGNSLYKVETNIPKVIEVDGKPLLTYVGTTGGKAFQRTTYDKLYWDQFATYTGKMDKWFKIGDILYVSSPNHNLGKYINIQGVFEDPQATNSYITCECDNEATCYTGFDFDYPFPSSMLDTLYKMLMTAELRFADLHTTDNLNDGKDESELK